MGLWRFLIQFFLLLEDILTFMAGVFNKLRFCYSTYALLCFVSFQDFISVGVDGGGRCLEEAGV